MLKKNITCVFSKYIINRFNKNKACTITGCNIYTSAVKNITSDSDTVSSHNDIKTNIDPTTVTDVAFINRTLPFMNGYVKPMQAWVVNLDSMDEQLLSLIKLHPEVYGAPARLDIIKENVVWQQKYKWVDYTHTPIAMEVNKSMRKPWPQKGTGRARHGTRRSHLFLGGGKLHGPRSPTSHFYMMPYAKRISGLCSTLSVKLAQDDLHIVKDLEIPSENPQYLLDLIHYRNWGHSVLFVDVDDVMPKNITLATDKVKYLNLMPLYGLNVYSMLKHETLVLTLAAALKLEEKLLLNLHSSLILNQKARKYKVGENC